jgi:hypothetical protein
MPKFTVMATSLTSNCITHASLTCEQRSKFGCARHPGAKMTFPKGEDLKWIKINGKIRVFNVLITYKDSNNY